MQRQRRKLEGLGRRYRRDLGRIRPAAWSFLAGSALMGAANGIPWTLFNLYLDRRSFPKEAIGSIQSAEAWGQILVALPAAFVLARRRTPPVLALSCLATAAGYAVLPWLPSAAAMQACRVVIGCAWWLHAVAIAPFLYRHSRPAERSTLFGLAEAVHTGAAVLACALCGRAAELCVALGASEVEGMGIVLSAGALLPLLAALCYARIHEERPPVPERVAILARAREHKGLLVRFALPQLVVGSGAGLCIPFLGLYFQDRFGSSPATVGELNAAWQALATLGFLLSPVLARRLGYVGAIVLVELSSIPFFLVLAFTGSYTFAVGAFLLRGALMNASGPILKTFLMEASPEGLRELQVALHNTAWGFAWAIGPWLGGALLSATGDRYDLLMCTTVLFYVTASLSSWLLLGPLDPRRRARGAAVAAVPVALAPDEERPL